MSGSEVQGCVELVTAAFHDAAIIAGRLNKKNKVTKGQTDQRHALLFQSLNDAGRRLQETYEDGYESFGSAYQLGDNEARQSLLAIAVDMNSKITQALQSAIDNDNIEPDVARLHESAITYRHDAIRALTDLNYRLELILPVSNFSRFSPDSSTEDLSRLDIRRPSPPAIGQSPADLKNGLRRLLSTSNAATRRARSRETKTRRRATAHQDSTPMPLNVAPIVTKLENQEAQLPQLPESPSSSHPDRRRSMIRRKGSASNLDLDDFNTAQPSRTQTSRVSVITTPHNNGGISLLMDSDHEVSPLDEVDESTVDDCLDMYDLPFRRPVAATPLDWTPVSAVPPVPPPRRRPPVQGIANFPQVPATQPLKLVTNTAIGHSGRANVISPIAELDDSVSVTSRDYDKDSIYSCQDEDSASSSLETPTSTSTAPTSNASDPSTPKSDRGSDRFEPRSFLRMSIDSGLGEADRSRDASPSDLSSTDADSEPMPPPPRVLRKKKSFPAAPSTHRQFPLPIREHADHTSFASVAEPTTRPVWHKRAPTADSGYSSAESNGHESTSTIPIMNNTVPIYNNPAPVQTPRTRPVRPVRPITTINDIDVISANSPRPMTSQATTSPTTLYEFPSTTFGAMANASAISTFETKPVPMDQAPPRPSGSFDKKNRWNLMRELRDQKHQAPQTSIASKVAKEKERERTNMIKNKAMSETFGF